MINNTVKRCNKCINKCRLDEPRCKTGRELAESVGIFDKETVEVENKSQLAMLIESYLWKLRNR